MVPLLRYELIESLVPADSKIQQLQSPLSIFSDLNSSLSTGAFARAACASWALGSAPYHCVESRPTYGVLAALSLTFSGVATLLPVYILCIKTIYARCVRRDFKRLG